MNPYQVSSTNDATLIVSFITLISADVLSPGRFKSFFLSFTFSDLKLKENDSYSKPCVKLPLKIRQNFF